MNHSTITTLNDLNRQFYQITNPYLNHTPNYFWAGWDDLYQKLQLSAATYSNVLDVGCGDGRFLEFLLTRDSSIDNYVGIDNSQTLLNIARQRATRHNFSKTQFIETDLIFEKWTEILSKNKPFNLIALFGILHHIPGQKLRYELLKQAVSLMQPNSILVFTTFQYQDIPRLQRQIIDKNSLEGKAKLQSLNINPNELESGDNILEWTKVLFTKEIIKAYRYSHYFSEIEIEELLLNSGLKLIESFTEQAFEGGLNKYFITQIISENNETKNTPRLGSV